jgi:hypothetical protein
MFCPYVISTLYHLLEELQMRTFKRYFSHTILLTILHLREMSELRSQCCLSQQYFIGHYLPVAAKDIVVFMAQDY